MLPGTFAAGRRLLAAWHRPCSMRSARGWPGGWGPRRSQRSVRHEGNVGHTGRACACAWRARVRARACACACASGTCHVMARWRGRGAERSWHGRQGPVGRRKHKPPPGCFSARASSAWLPRTARSPPTAPGSASHPPPPSAACRTPRHPRLHAGTCCAARVGTGRHASSSHDEDGDDGDMRMV